MYCSNITFISEIPYLTKVDQSVYTLLTMADTHVCGGVNRRANADEVQLYSSELMPTLRECVAGAEGRTYIITLGDMTQVGYRPSYREGKEGAGYSFTDYMRDTNVDVPIFNVISSLNIPGKDRLLRLAREMDDRNDVIANMTQQMQQMQMQNESLNANNAALQQELAKMADMIGGQQAL